MTDSNDSGLFGNNEDLYGNENTRRDEEYEPFAQAQPPAHEPLFPASAPADHAWIDATPQSVIYPHNYQSSPYDDQSDSNLHYDMAESHEATEPAATPSTPYSNGAAAAYPARDDYRASTMPYTQPAIDFTAADLNDASYLSGHAIGETTSPISGYIIDHTPDHLANLGDYQAEAPEPRPLTEREVRFNHQFALLNNLMQHGAWPQALEKLQAMRAEYPNVAALDSLLDEATLKAELMATWTHKIKGRRLTVGQEWLLRRSLPFLLLLVLFISGTIFYRTYIAPSRQVMAMARANQALVEEAAGLLQVGQVDEAIDLYNLVLSRNPDNVAARQGLEDASHLTGLAATYDLAIRIANAGNLKRSLSMLQSIKAKSPTFRDIDARIDRVTSLLNAEAAYKQAEKAFTQHRWLDAIANYEATQVAAADYQAVRVQLQLSAAYFLAAQKLMTQWPTPEYDTQKVRDFLRRAQAVNPQDEAIRAFLPQLDDFIRGERELRNNNLDQVIKAWRSLYEAQPDFLGGYLAEQLYRAYLALAAQVRASDTAYASELYTRAASLPVHDSSEARNQLQNLGAATPPAQPTPTPRPTAAYVAPVAAVAAAAPADTPTPAPTAPPANPYAGWIAFRSTRDGSEQIYIMRGDGSEQQLAPEELRASMDTLYQNARRGPDGRMILVQAATGRSDADLYIVSRDGVNKTEVTTYSGDEYDPVWSPNGERIAFVANHTGNDEIWVMNGDGSNQQQLTSNNWEWDKHPTWSPDSSQLAFFSNRSGQRQIWVMGSDGSNQRNLSNNSYDDWDPVWIQ